MHGATSCRPSAFTDEGLPASLTQPFAAVTDATKGIRDTRASVPGLTGDSPRVFFWRTISAFWAPGRLHERSRVAVCRASRNILWFCARYPRFVYVDRIVVASSARGRGCARRLYRDLFEYAVRAGHERVVCEVNISPPNPASNAFHAALGFVEVGTASVYSGARRARTRNLEIPRCATAHLRSGP